MPLSDADFLEIDQVLTSELNEEQRYSLQDCFVECERIRDVKPGVDYRTTKKHLTELAKQCKKTVALIADIDEQNPDVGEISAAKIVKRQYDQELKELSKSSMSFPTLLEVEARLRLLEQCIKVIEEELQRNCVGAQGGRGRPREKKDIFIDILLDFYEDRGLGARPGHLSANYAPNSNNGVDGPLVRFISLVMSKLGVKASALGDKIRYRVRQRKGKTYMKNKQGSALLTV